MFAGWSEHTLDSKGRVAIPARFRDVLKANHDERLIITTLKDCLVGYTYEGWRDELEKVRKLSHHDPEAQAFKRYFISAASECTCDKQGRILIPQTLRDFAGLDGQIMLAGMIDYFEIWDRERWFVERDRIQQNFVSISSAIAERGI